MDIVKEKQRMWNVRVEEMNGDMLVKKRYKEELIGR